MPTILNTNYGLHDCYEFKYNDCKEKVIKLQLIREVSLIYLEGIKIPSNVQKMVCVIRIFNNFMEKFLPAVIT